METKQENRRKNKKLLLLLLLLLLFLTGAAIAIILILIPWNKSTSITTSAYGPTSISYVSTDKRSTQCKVNSKNFDVSKSTINKSDDIRAKYPSSTYRYSDFLIITEPQKINENEEIIDIKFNEGMPKDSGIKSFNLFIKATWQANVSNETVFNVSLDFTNISDVFKLTTLGQFVKYPTDGEIVYKAISLNKATDATYDMFDDETVKIERDDASGTAKMSIVDSGKWQGTVILSFTFKTPTNVKEFFVQTHLTPSMGDAFLVKPKIGDIIWKNKAINPGKNFNDLWSKISYKIIDSGAKGKVEINGDGVFYEGNTTLTYEKII